MDMNASRFTVDFIVPKTRETTEYTTAHQSPESCWLTQLVLDIRYDALPLLGSCLDHSASRGEAGPPMVIQAILGTKSIFSGMICITAIMGTKNFADTEEKA